MLDVLVHHPVEPIHHRWLVGALLPRFLQPNTLTRRAGDVRVLQVTQQMSYRPPFCELDAYQRALPTEAHCQVGVAKVDVVATAATRYITFLTERRLARHTCQATVGHMEEAMFLDPDEKSKFSMVA